MHLQIKVRRPRQFLEEGDTLDQLVAEVIEAVRGRGENDALSGITVDVIDGGIRFLPVARESILHDQDELVRAIIAHLTQRHAGRLLAEEGYANVELVASLSDLPAALAHYATDEYEGPYTVLSVIPLDSTTNGLIDVSVGLDKEWKGPRV